MPARAGATTAGAVVLPSRPAAAEVAGWGSGVTHALAIVLHVQSFRWGRPGGPGSPLDLCRFLAVNGFPWNRDVPSFLVRMDGDVRI